MKKGTKRLMLSNKRIKLSKLKKIKKEIAGRLLLLRELRFTNAKAMAASVYLTPQRWYNYETGRRSLDELTATIVVEEHGVDFNWLYSGSMSTLEEKVRRELIAQGEKVRPKKKPRKKRPSRARVVTTTNSGDAITRTG